MLPEILPTERISLPLPLPFRDVLEKDCSAAAVPSTRIYCKPFPTFPLSTVHETIDAAWKREGNVIGVGTMDIWNISSCTLFWGLHAPVLTYTTSI